MSRSGLNEVYLSFVSYVVLATFLLIELSFGVLTRSQAVTVPTLVFVYISYSLLPVKLQYAIVAGTVFMLSQLIFVLSMEQGISKQVRSTTIFCDNAPCALHVVFLAICYLYFIRMAKQVIKYFMINYDNE